MTSLLHPPLPDALQPRVRWHQLYGSAAALALAEAAAAERRLYVLIADGARELERLTAELRFFAGAALPLLRLPDWEVLPYDLFSPHPDIISERLQTLYELPHVRHGCLIVAADTLMQRLAPRQLRAGPRLRARDRPVAGARAVPPAPRRGRLRERQPGGEPGGVRRARLAPRRLSDGRDHAAAHRPVRRRDRGDPPLRSGHTALPRHADARAPAAGTRSAARQPGGQGVPPPLPHALRGRSDPQRHLPRRERGAGAGRSGVLPAAVLRSHRDARRLPAAGCGDRARCGAARRAGASLERDRRALRGSPPRHRASAAFPGGAVSRPAAARRRARAVRHHHARAPSRPTSSCRALPTYTTSPPPRRASCASTCAPRSRSPRSPLSCASSTAGCCSPQTRRAGARCCRRCCALTATRWRSSTAGRRSPPARRVSRSPWPRTSRASRSPRRRSP